MKRLQNHPEFVQTDAAILNTDNAALAAYKKQKAKFQNISNIEKELVELQRRVLSLEQKLGTTNSK